MRNIYPDYYNEFKCIADACPCSCCAGWQIEIDEASLERYEKLNITSVDYTNESFFQDDSDQKRCINLDDSGLCKLILEHSEDILCDTCRLFPRHIEEFEKVREYSLSISCPEVARMLLTRDQAITFSSIENEDSDPEEYDEFEQEVYQQLVALRDQALEILQSKAGDLSTKCKVILEKVNALQLQIDGLEAETNCEVADLETLFAVMEEWEYTNNEFPIILANARKVLQLGGKDSLEYLARQSEFVFEMQLQQIIVYFMYAYFCGSVYDEYYYGMAQLAVCSAIHIKLLCDAHFKQWGSITELDIERYTYLYARELEHSIPNVLATEAWMDENRIV